jgi:uncharacterized protein YjiK
LIALPILANRMIQIKKRTVTQIIVHCKKCLYLVVIALLMMSCKAQQFVFPYTLNQPTNKHHLPPILNEISGLTDWNATTVACVQDELGIIFIYDFIEGKIISEHPFDTIGDYEGLTYSNNDLYILRSDGRLSIWKHFPQNPDSIQHHQLLLNTANNESLCYDPKTKSLWIGAKSKPNNPEEKEERLIYQFNLNTYQLENEPIYSLNILSMAEKAKVFNIQTEQNKKGELKPFNFRPSSIAVHPISFDIYIISAADNLLVILNRKGEITYMEKLLPELYPKAEGITFLPDGTMIITNEAAGQTPSLLVFKMKL